MLLSLINKLQEFFLITSYLNDNSSIKGAEQLRIPGARPVFLVLGVVKVVRSIVEHSGDHEGPSQEGASLCGFC